MSTKALRSKAIRGYHYIVLALLVVLACLGLGYIDHETTSVMDLFKPGNMLALFLYFFPAYVLSLLFLRLFSKNIKGAALILYSFFCGTFLGFLIALLSLYLIMRT